MKRISKTSRSAWVFCVLAAVCVSGALVVPYGVLAEQQTDPQASEKARDLTKEAVVPQSMRKSGFHKVTIYASDLDYCEGNCGCNGFCSGWICRKCGKLCACDKAGADHKHGAAWGPGGASGQWMTQAKMDETTKEVTLSAKWLPCLSFFTVGGTKLGIRNNCDHCMTAVVSFGSGKIRYYDLPAHDQISIEMEGLTADLIGEQPCK